VSAASSSRTRTRSGNTTTVQGQHATGSRTVQQTGEGYNVNKQVTTQSGASKSVSKDVNLEDREVDRSSTTTNKWGQSATREREIEGQGGYATIEGSAKTSTGREASADLVAGRTVYGQPAVAGSVNTKYSGNYNVAAARNPYGGWTANYNLGSGLAVGVSMEATGNWEADEHWTAPLLFQISKVTLLGKRPVNLAVAAGPTVVSPAGGANWRFRLVATFLFPR
jgi:hypothetical protein